MPYGVLLCSPVLVFGLGSAIGKRPKQLPNRRWLPSNRLRSPSNRLCTPSAAAQPPSVTTRISLRVWSPIFAVMNGWGRGTESRVRAFVLDMRNEQSHPELVPQLPALSTDDAAFRRVVRRRSFNDWCHPEMALDFPVFSGNGLEIDSVLFKCQCPTGCSFVPPSWSSA